MSRVWSALTDYREFGEWFKVKLESPFLPGQVSRGQITYPDYEHITWEARIEQMEPERLFSYRWHPGAVDPDIDYSAEPTTLVVFELEEVADGVMLTVTESGFDQIPLARRAKAFASNDSGWAMVMKLIERYVSDGQ